MTIISLKYKATEAQKHMKKVFMYSQHGFTKDKSRLTNPNALLWQKTVVRTKHHISPRSHLEGEEAQAASRS